MSGFDDQTSLASPTGANLNLLHMRPKDKLRAVVHINHGLAEHAARYQPFADYLSQVGFAVFAHDHRGHGHTTASDATAGRFAEAPAGRGWEKVVADSLAVNTRARTEYPQSPLITFGHSMGGLIAMNFALSHPDRQIALAVWNSNFKMGLEGRVAQAILAAERMLKGSDVPSGMLSRLTFEAWGKAIKNAKTRSDWLSHDTAAVSAYIEDPLCGWDPTVGLWQDIFAMAFHGSNRAALAALPKTMPIHLVGGGQDPATAKGRAVTWFARKLRGHGMEDVTCCIYEGLRHETLNESAPPGAHGAMEDFAAWALSAPQRGTAAAT